MNDYISYGKSFISNYFGLSNYSEEENNFNSSFMMNYIQAN